MYIQDCSGFLPCSSMPVTSPCWLRSIMCHLIVAKLSCSAGVSYLNARDSNSVDVSVYQAQISAWRIFILGTKKDTSYISLLLFVRLHFDVICLFISSGILWVTYFGNQMSFSGWDQLFVPAAEWQRRPDSVLSFQVCDDRSYCRCKPENPAPLLLGTQRRQT